MPNNHSSLRDMPDLPFQGGHQAGRIQWCDYHRAVIVLTRYLKERLSWPHELVDDYGRSLLDPLLVWFSIDLDHLDDEVEYNQQEEARWSALDVVSDAHRDIVKDERSKRGNSKLYKENSALYMVSGMIPPYEQIWQAIASKGILKMPPKPETSFFRGVATRHVFKHADIALHELIGRGDTATTLRQLQKLLLEHGVQDLSSTLGSYYDHFEEIWFDLRADQQLFIAIVAKALHDVVQNLHSEGFVPTNLLYLWVPPLNEIMAKVHNLSPAASSSPAIRHLINHPSSSHTSHTAHSLGGEMTNRKRRIYGLNEYRR